MLKIFVLLRGREIPFEENPKGKINHCTEKRTIKLPVNCFKKMNKEKLIDIILKDVEELKDIAEEIGKDGSAAKLETDIALSKATLIVQELHLLKEKYIAGNFHPVVEKTTAPVLPEQEMADEPEEKPIVNSSFEIVEENQTHEEEITEKISAPILILDEEADREYGDFEEKEKLPIEDDDTFLEEDNTDEEGDVASDEDRFEVAGEEEDKIDAISSFDDEDDFDADAIPEQEDDESDNGDDFENEEDEFADVEIPEDEDDISVEEPEFERRKNEPDEEDDSTEEVAGFDGEDGLDEEEDDLPPVGKTIGENFRIGKSLNDMMGNKNNNDDTLDQKFAHGPISSLQSAIGINDRFLFIREMFNNDAQLYATAIKRLDECADLREAVEYLSSNFRIKKTETSLRFVELIKRRFAK